jgi:hypothetical protein
MKEFDPDSRIFLKVFPDMMNLLFDLDLLLLPWVVLFAGTQLHQIEI